MNAPAPHDKDLPLREDTRLLGRVLGDVLRAQTGDEGFDRMILVDWNNDRTGTEGDTNTIEPPADERGEQ